MAGKKIGVVIVHGIGEQQPGQSSQKFVDGLRIALGAAIEYPDEGKKPLQPESAGVLPRPREVAIRGLDRTLVLYEVYWADIMAADKAAGSFQIQQLIALPWTPRLNSQFGLYGNSPPRFMPQEESLLFLYLVSTCAFYGYYGLRQVVNLAGLIGALFLSALFLLLVPAATVSRLVAFLPGMKTPVKAFHNALRRLADWDRRRHASKPPDGRHPIDVLLDGYVGDVLTYVNSLGRQLISTRVPDWDAGTAVLRRFHTRLQEACNECDEVHVLAHSLGTVIAYHGITGYGLPAACDEPGQRRELLSNFKGLYTFGSPIAKFRYFWPMLVGYQPTRVLLEEGKTVRARCVSDVLECEWLNFYNPLDLVSGKLTAPPGFPSPMNISVLEGGLIASHIRYERNATFLGRMTARLFGAEVKPQELEVGRFRGLFKSLAESFVGVGGFAVLVAVGLATQLGVLWLLAKGVGELVRLFSSDGVAIWAMRSTWVISFGVSLALTAGAGLRLARIQTANWALWKESPKS